MIDVLQSYTEVQSYKVNQPWRIWFVVDLNLFLTKVETTSM